MSNLNGIENRIKGMFYFNIWIETENVKYKSIEGESFLTYTDVVEKH